MPDVTIKEKTIGRYHAEITIVTGYYGSHYEVSLYEERGGQYYTVLEGTYSTEEKAKACFYRFTRYAKIQEGRR